MHFPFFTYLCFFVSHLLFPLPPCHMNCVWPLFPGHCAWKSPLRHLSPFCCWQSERQKSGMNSPTMSLLVPRSPKPLPRPCAYPYRVVSVTKSTQITGNSGKYLYRVQNPFLERFLKGFAISTHRNSGNMTTSIGCVQWCT